jgi:hypothetical protein
MKAMDHCFVLDRVPRDEAKYPKEWLTAKIVDTVKRHYGRILNPKRDIYFEEDECDSEVEGEKRPCYRIVLLIDGWSHMHPIKDFDKYFKDTLEIAPVPLDQVERKHWRDHFVPMIESDSEDEVDEDK